MELNSYPNDSVFASELEILQAAKSEIHKPQRNLDELPGKFEKLAADYEKLLKTTMKISKISDIQGRTLKQQELELTNAHGHLLIMQDLQRQLIQDISHELGTPLTRVQGFVGAFLDGVVTPDERYMTMIYNNLLLMNHLIDDLFQFSSLQADQIQFHFKKIQMEDLIGLIPAKFAMDAAQRGIRLVLEEPVPFQGLQGREVLMLTRVDPIRIEQVLNNYIDNALKYTGEGGEIRISCELQGSPEPSTGEENKESGQSQYQLLLKVSDSGEGINEEDLPYVFERFYRSKSSRKAGMKGSGLGLAISKEIIHKHGGKVGVSSEPGQGSTFYFTLPVELISLT